METTPYTAEPTADPYVADRPPLDPALAVPAVMPPVEHLPVPMPVPVPPTWEPGTAAPAWDADAALTGMAAPTMPPLVSGRHAAATPDQIAMASGLAPAEAPGEPSFAAAAPAATPVPVADPAPAPASVAAPAASPAPAAEALSAMVAAVQASATPAPPAPAPAPQAPAAAPPAPEQSARMRRDPGPDAPIHVAGPEADETAYSRATTEEALHDDDFSLIGALHAMLAAGASDLHLTAGAPPTMRLNGDLVAMDGFAVLQPPSIQRVMYSAITQIQRERFEAELELDFAYSMPGHGRFRVNMYKQRDAVGAAFRVIPYDIKDLDTLGVPPAVASFATLPRGFVLVTGPTGSGKSTTLAALVDLANRTRHDHIMTVEDPIEFIHRHKQCLVNQREVGEDTHGFSAALKHVLRQDPDIILVGEMRDLETISVALTAAETGHLVFATLHTQDAAQTIDRMIDVFPPHQQQQVRQQLAGTLQGVVCQTLCKTKDGKGRVAACEVLVVTPAIRNLIREGKTHQIYSSMQAGGQFGMQTLDQDLARLSRQGAISYEVGLEKAHHAEDYNRLSGRV